MFLPKNTLPNITSGSDEEKKIRNMINYQPNESTVLNNDTRKSNEDINSNIFKNNLSENFFQKIYENLREILQSYNINRFQPKDIQNQYPMLLSEPSVLPEPAEKQPTNDPALTKSLISSPNPYEEQPKLYPSSPRFNSNNTDDKFGLYKTPLFGQENTSFLGRKTVKSNKENINSSFGNDLFKISKPNGSSNSNLNLMNDEEDLQKYLECHEKNEESNKISFDTNFLLDSENLFDFNGNNNANNVNINNNVNPGQEKEFF